MNTSSTKRKRGTGQKISYFFAIFCYLMSLVSVVFSIYWKINNGTQSPIFSSALACVFFFLSCGFVLQYIANASLPNFKQQK